MTVLLTKEANGKILIMTLSGTLSVDDYAHFAVEVERAIAEHGKIRFLVEMYDFHGWTTGALWKDIEFNFSRDSHIERVPLVGDRKREQGMARFCRPFTTATVRYFDKADANEARIWFHEEIFSTSEQSC